ncbi:hypothetical protein D3C73_1006470 [compost metagenome]
MIKAVVVRDIWIHLETVIFEKAHHFPMIAKLNAVGVTYIVEKSAQFSFRCRTRIQVSQCSSCSVSGIFKRLKRSLVIFGENRQIHDAFALHFNCSITVRDGQRYRFNGLDLGKYALPHHPITTC